MAVPRGAALEGGPHGYRVDAATSCSGDVVVGALTGLLARGNGAIPSMLRAVRAHAEAGARALHGQNATGLLARDVVHELPGAFDALCDEADAPPL